MRTRTELLALADAAQAAAETITEVNARDGNGPAMPWTADHLADYSRNLQIEADELDDDPYTDTACVHCGVWDGQPHDRTCREGMDE